MSPSRDRDRDDDGVFSGSESENDDAFDEDMEALRRACMLTGTDPAAAAAATAAPSGSDAESDDDDEEDDLELLRTIQKRFSVSSFSTSQQPLSLPPLCSLPPAAAVSDDDDDDFETLRAIQRRFSSYDSMNKDRLGNNTEDFIQKPEEALALTVVTKDTSNYLSKNTSNGCKDLLDNEAAGITTDFSSDNVERSSSGFIEWHQSGEPNLSTLALESSSFPKSAHMFFDAIKKNRLCQKFIHSKLIQIEARIEENKKLKERVKILKDYQASCRRRTGVALSQKKDPRVQLISAQKPWTSNNSKMDDKKVSAMYCGPADNSHVGNYRMALTKYPLSLERKKWSDAEKENLGKGIRQQFQEMILQISMHRLSQSDGSAGESNSIDAILATIKNHEITSDQIRDVLPKINWEQLASMYVAGRSSAECEARWLNCEDPLINHGPWTPQEDKNLLLTVQEIGIGNWFNIAASLRTNRTPFQCLARYQRSLNACILKKEWTEDEDDQLRIAVETFGECNWQAVASTLEGRTGTQCSNRWKKTLHPSRQKTGRWIPDEDKRMKVAVMLFGPKNWGKIAQFVPGRTQVQCRERWVNSLDPSLKWGAWTKEEDSRLRAAIVEHGYCWSKVASCVPPRTDSQCRRRWKVLLPDEVPLLQAAKKIQKTALIGNFVDRELERPALGPEDFIPVAACLMPNSEVVNSSRKRKRKLRVGAESNKEDAAPRNISRPKRSRRARNGNKNSQWVTDHSEVETLGECDAIIGKETETTIKKNKSVGPDTKGKGKSYSHSEQGKCSELDMDNCGLVSGPNCSDLGTTNGCGIEASNVSTTSAKKKRAPKKSSGMSNVPTVQLGNFQNQPETGNRGLVFPLEYLELGTAGGCDFEASNGAITASKKKTKAPKKPSRKSTSTVKSGDLQNHKGGSSNIFMPTGTNNGIDVIPDLSCLQIAPPMITNVEEVDIICRDDTAMTNRVPKLRSRRKADKEPIKDGNGISSIPVPSEVTINSNGYSAESLCIDESASIEEHGALEEHHPGNSVPETLAKCFASIPQKGLGNPALIKQPLSNQNCDKTSKKNRSDVAEHANQGCSGLHPRLSGVAEENQSLPIILNGGTKISERPPKELRVYSRRRFRCQANQTCCSSQAPESWTRDKLQLVHLKDIPANVEVEEPGPKNLDKGQTMGVPEPMGEKFAMVNDYHKGSDSDDITVASFLKKLKKRRAGR